MQSALTKTAADAAARNAADLERRRRLAAEQVTCSISTMYRTRGLLLSSFFFSGSKDDGRTTTTCCRTKSERSTNDISQYASLNRLNRRKSVARKNRK